MNYSFNFLLKYGIDYSYTSWEFVKNWAENSSNIAGILSVLIFTPILLIAIPKKAALKFKKKCPDEEVLYTSRNNILFTIIILYCTGALFGNYIIPFLYFKNTFNLNNVYFYSWIGFIIGWCILIYIIGLRYALTYIFTNTKIEFISAFDLYDNLVKRSTQKLKKLPIKYEDILRVESDCLSNLYIINTSTKKQLYFLEQNQRK